jgi:4-hydroxybenzoate polyprenyltransferase
MLYLAGQQFKLGIVFYSGLGVSSLFFIYQQYLIRDRDPQKSFQAFLNNHYFGMMVFIAIAFEYNTAV